MKKYNWEKILKEWERDLPFPPPLSVIPTEQSPYEKKMAKLMEKMINYQYAQIHASKKKHICQI